MTTYEVRFDGENEFALTANPELVKVRLTRLLRTPVTRVDIKPMSNTATVTVPGVIRAPSEQAVQAAFDYTASTLNSYAKFGMHRWFYSLLSLL